MRGRIACLLVVLVAGPAAGERLVAQRHDRGNLHIAGDRGAINRQADITITLDLDARGKLRVRATGARNHHDLGARRANGDAESTDEETTWTTTWSGTYARTAGGLRLDLALGTHACASERRSSIYATEKLACKRPSKRARLACASERIDLREGRSEEAWRCTVAHGELAESPSPWLFGKAACLAVHGGMMMEDHVRPCGTP